MQSRGGGMEVSKEEFLRQFGGDYGYPGAPKGVDEMRAAEFKRLEGAPNLDLVDSLFAKFWEEKWNSISVL